MSWKLSKRQAQLKKRLIDSSHVYFETSHTLDRMLLKMLHNNGVYTPDDFYEKYVKPDHFSKTKHNILLYRLYHENRYKANQSINKTLLDLNQVLIQLKQIISEQSKAKNKKK